MLKQLLAAFRSDDTVDQAFSQLDEMLDHARWMFIRANEVLRREVPAEEVRDALYRRDQSINDLLRGIRNKIVRHLTINPRGDVVACLALFSVAKDAERIGDYCKNVFEVGRFYGEDFHVDRYHDPLRDIGRQCTDLFEVVRRAFKDFDPAQAKAAIRASEGVRGRCDEIIEQLLRDSSNIETHEAVAYSLLARHYKRVASHLSNICTAVLGKIEHLDFADE